MTDYLTIVRAVYGGLSQRQAATRIMFPEILFHCSFGMPRTKDGLLLRTSAELTPQLFPLLC